MGVGSEGAKRRCRKGQPSGRWKGGERKVVGNRRVGLGLNSCELVLYAMY